MMIGVLNSKCKLQYLEDKDKWGSCLYSDAVDVLCNKYSKSNYRRGSYKESIEYAYVYILYDTSVCLQSLLDGHMVKDIEVVCDIEGDYLYTICCV